MVLTYKLPSDLVLVEREPKVGWWDEREEEWRTEAGGVLRTMSRMHTGARLTFRVDAHIDARARFVVARPSFEHVSSARFRVFVHSTSVESLFSTTLLRGRDGGEGGGRHADVLHGEVLPPGAAAEPRRHGRGLLRTIIRPTLNRRILFHQALDRR